MALRFMLVSLVAGLGVNMPSGGDVSSWVESGRAWVEARVVEFRGSDQAADEARADVAFAGVVDEMAGTFTADLAESGRPLEAPALLAYNPLEASEDAGIEADPVAVEREAPALAEMVESEDDAIEPMPTASPDRTGRVASALQLTRQAAEAWVNVLGQ